MDKTLLAMLALTATVANVQALSCFSRDSTTASNSNGTSVICSSSYSTCFAYTHSSGYNFGGCGTCLSGSYEDCTTCSTDHCNPRTPSHISCFSRSSSSNTNGTMTTCHAGVTTCYSYSTGNFFYGGCGNCSLTSTHCSNSSFMCSTSYCNTVTPYINCYYSAGNYLHSNRQKRTCTTTSCYEYSYKYGITDVFFADCGSCSSYRSSYLGCRTCYTEYCNSAPAAGVSVKTAAVSGLLLLAAMKLF